MSISLFVQKWQEKEIGSSKKTPGIFRDTSLMFFSKEQKHCFNLLQLLMSPFNLSCRSLLYGSRRSLYSTYTMSGMSYVLPIVAKQPDPWRRPPDNWPIAFLSIFINPIFGIFALLLSGMQLTTIFFHTISFHGQTFKNTCSTHLQNIVES